MSINMANVKSITLGGVSVKKIENLNGDVLWEGTPALSYITISGYTTTFYQGDTFSFGGTVTAHYTNGSTQDVTSSAVFSGYNMSSISTQRVTVSYTENGITKTTSYYISVKAAPLYIVLGGRLFLLDKSTKTFSEGTVTDPSARLTNSSSIWNGGDTAFYSNGSITNSYYQKKINISGSDLVTTGLYNHYSGSGITSFTRQQVFYNGTDYYIHQGNGAGTTKDYRIDLETGALTGVAFSGWSIATNTSTGVTYSHLFKFNGTVYFIRDSNHVGKLSGTSWSSVHSTTGTSSDTQGSYFWTPDNVNLYEIGGNRSLWITNVNTWASQALFSDVTISNPANIFKMNGNVYYLQYDSTNRVYKFYQLKANTIGTNSLKWTDVSSQFNADALPKANYGDYIFMEKDGTSVSCSCYYEKSQ